MVASVLSYEYYVNYAAPSLPPPSQRWSSYDGLHVDHLQQFPPPLNPTALSIEVKCHLLILLLCCNNAE